MSATPRCPHCGADLDAPGSDATTSASFSPRITDSWEALRSQVAEPTSMSDRDVPRAPTGPTWWLPSLAYLAHSSAGDEARAALDRFAAHRHELSYAVVEEQTDTVIGLTIQPWPIVDDEGRLRFPIRTDPLQVDVPGRELTEILNRSRRWWSELGLLQEELIERAIHLGDVYAVVVTDRPGPDSVAVHSDDGSECYLGPLESDSGTVPIVDITWDAREAGKLAHYAAAAGIVEDEEQPRTPGAPTVADETEERYLIAFRDHVDPRDVPPPPEASA
jgi:hypothetical protein